MAAGRPLDKFGDLYDADARRDPYFAEYVTARELLATDWRKALKDMEALAHRGSIMSMLFVSDAMRDGYKYDQDLPCAERWYRVAVESGSVRGQAGLATTHVRMGRYAQAVEELESAIAKRYPPAMNSLAVMYFRGDSIPQDKAKALDLWCRGASLGHYHSKRHLIGQSLHGKFGFWKAIWAAWLFFPTVMDLAKIRFANRYSDRMR
jgi:TPR repeat protein